MTVSSGFFNSINHDRLYDAEQLSSIFDGIIIDGVYENYGDAFMVTANPDANSSVIIGTGRAWFDHTWTLNDSQFAMQLDPPNELLARTDAIVIDVDRRTDIRKNSIVYVKGSEATPDNPPAFIKEDLHKQYPICYIKREAKVNSPIEQQDITITVGTSVCPIVTGYLSSQNLENLLVQLDAEFNTWWDGIKDTLDENTVTKLQNQIDEINEKLNSPTATVGLLEKSVAEMYMSGDYSLGFSSSKFDYSVPLPDDDTVDSIGNTNYGYYKICGFLPDGYRFFAARAAYGQGSASPKLVQFVFGISDLNGVKTYNRLTMANSSTTNRYDYSTANLYYAYGQFDVFPVELNFILYTGYANGDVRNIAWHIKVTVSSAHTVSIQNVSKVGPVDESWSTMGGSNMGYTEWITATESSSNFLFGYTYNYRGNNVAPVSGTTAVGWTGKLTRDGVLVAPVRTNDVYPIYAGPGNQRVVIQYVDCGEYYAVMTPNENSFWTKVDPNTLVATKMTEAKPSSSELIRHSISSYNLSEAGGLILRKYKVGSPMDQYEDEKLSPYFIGGDNLGNGLIEGSFTAKNVDGVIVGIGPSGEQIAIGSNGGAAILKSKKSAATINYANGQRRFPGQIITDDGTQYTMLVDASRQGTDTYQATGSIIKL